jgi:hypothetical protein
LTTLVDVPILNFLVVGIDYFGFIEEKLDLLDSNPAGTLGLELSFSL